MKKQLIALFVFVLLGSCASQPLLPPDQRASVDADFKAPFDVNSVYFNSRDTNSKSPYGAVKAGQEVEFTLTSRSNDLDSVRLVISMKIIEGHMDSVDLVDTQEIEMVKTARSPEVDVWTAAFTPTISGLFSYYFSLNKGSFEAYLGNNQRSVKMAHVEVSGTGGVGQIGSTDYVLPFDLMVYTDGVVMDRKWKNQVIYYIFPERFKNGNKANDQVPGRDLTYGREPVEFHTNWNDPAPYVPGSGDGNTADDQFYNNDFYGGDLDGIISKLDYIKGLGTTLIYMTPIFRASSSHKYDTADYMTIDPHFGSLDTFKKLVSEAKKRGIGIILDASLNHSGSDSVYMDRFSKYNSQGAFAGEVIRKDSPYYDWYEWVPGAKQPGQMYKQWAVESLANLKESDSWKNFAFRNKDSITKYWLRLGAAGWRMDVTPWVSDEFWQEWRSELKSEFPDSITYSEVWFDASKYLDGTMFDSNMNYFFRTAALELGMGRDTKGIQEIFEMLLERYPEEALYRMMNLTSTHDVPRTLWELGYKKYGHANYATKRSQFLLTSALQFTMPGSPTIYYGDEIGLTGGADPLNRGPYPWKEDGGDYGDFTLLEHYQSLAGMRQTYKDQMVFGTLEFLPSSGHFLGYRRVSEGGKRALVLFNNGETPLEVSFSSKDSGRYTQWSTKAPVVLDAESKLTLEPLSFTILLEE